MSTVRSAPETPFDSATVVVGMGQMGGVFARALLRAGHPVHPVLRKTPIERLAARLPDPALALVTVAEDDLPGVLSTLPEPWKGHAGLIQNELLPRDWIAAGIANPTVAVVWFEKKPQRHVKVIIPTPIGGPAAPLLAAALGEIDIPAVVVDDGERLEWELVKKNLYILTANIAGLVSGGTVSALWRDHRQLAERVAREVLDIQEWLVGRALDRDRLIAEMAEAFAADPEHGATGRSAPRRLERALAHAAQAGIETPSLQEIREKVRG